MKPEINQSALTADSLQPIKQSNRIDSLDLLRGFALLGILIVNIQGVAMISACYSNPTAYGDLEGLNYWSWWFTHVFFELKVMSMFSMLFGAGMALMSERALIHSKSVTGLHYRRMFWLLLIGLAHAYLIWYGDILVCYSLCGMLFFWCRNWRPLPLILLGVFLFSIPSLINVFFSMVFPLMSEKDLAELGANWAPGSDKVEAEIAAFRGSWMEQMPYRAYIAFILETFVFAIMFFWRASGLMLLGMAFYKSGIFSAARSTRFYLVGAIVFGTLGWALILYGVEQNFAHDWDVKYSMATGAQYNYWGSLCIALVYVCLLSLWHKSGGLKGLQHALKSVGQMALTNYLMQSFTMVYLFWGAGFGWIGQVDRFQQVLIVVAIWIMQLIVSPLWLKYYRYGPCEWLWRSLSYWRIQPLKR